MKKYNKQDSKLLELSILVNQKHGHDLNYSINLILLYFPPYLFIIYFLGMFNNMIIEDATKEDLILSEKMYPVRKSIESLDNNFNALQHQIHIEKLDKKRKQKQKQISSQDVRVAESKKWNGPIKNIQNLERILQEYKDEENTLKKILKTEIIILRTKNDVLGYNLLPSGKDTFFF